MCGGRGGREVKRRYVRGEGREGGEEKVGVEGEGREGGEEKVCAGEREGGG